MIIAIIDKGTEKIELKKFDIVMFCDNSNIGLINKSIIILGRKGEIYFFRNALWFLLGLLFVAFVSNVSS